MKRMPGLRPLSMLCLLLTGAWPALAQFEGPPLGSGPWTFQTYDEDAVRASVLARGMDHPFSMAFIPGTATVRHPLGDILITERYTGAIRLFRDGQLRDAPVATLMEDLPLQQLFQIDLHPDFADNGLVYFVWIKTAPHPDGGEGYWSTTAVSRARWDGAALRGLEQVFEADEGWSEQIGGATASLHFLPDGTFLMGVSHRLHRQAPQSEASHIGKVLRLKDDGTAPADNPFYAVESAAPEVFTLGNRSVMDFAIHPDTGAVWELENGPQGGDEVNILEAGANYGWPLATFGRDYDGTRFGPRPTVDGTRLPEVFWVPSVTVAGMTFYTGEPFPDWRGSLFVTSMIQGRIPGTGHLERIVFNENGEILREQLLNSLGQRIRQVVQGPDGLLYLLTDHSDGVLLRLAPGHAAVAGENPPAVSPAPGQGAEEQPLIAASDCRSCHRVNEGLVGPSYADIAGRYALNEDNIALLAQRIIQGGGGAWGDAPMAPHTDLSQAEARAMSQRILSLTVED